MLIDHRPPVMPEKYRINTASRVQPKLMGFVSLGRERRKWKCRILYNIKYKIDMITTDRNGPSTVRFRCRPVRAGAAHNRTIPCCERNEDN